MRNILRLYLGTIIDGTSLLLFFWILPFEIPSILYKTLQLDSFYYLLMILTSFAILPLLLFLISFILFKKGITIGLLITNNYIEYNEESKKIDFIITYFVISLFSFLLFTIIFFIPSNYPNGRQINFIEYSCRIKFKKSGPSQKLFEE